ncbi:hypothetical protein SYNPCC7002_A1187 [Picosynechococcus sp. PCC 7002]|nr:hypothetical protein SYNPCC7002_A1187 [Picosynechococcus sp. PCC 7002]
MVCPNLLTALHGDVCIAHSGTGASFNFPGHLSAQQLWATLANPNPTELTGIGVYAPIVSSFGGFDRLLHLYGLGYGPIVLPYLALLSIAQTERGRLRNGAVVPWAGGRLIDNLGRHNCLWLPRQAIADIAWHRMREEGAKRSYWVNRTRICYVSAKGKKHWLTLEGRIVDLGYSNHGHTDDRADRALYEALVKWWKGRSPQ